MTTPVLNPRWSLDDGAGDVYSFEVNPNEMSSPWEDINVVASVTTAGNFLLTQGSRQAKQFTFSGVLLTKDQYDVMVTWLQKKRRVYLIDHFGRRLIVFLTSFNPTPKRRVGWKHQYEMTMLVLSEPVDYAPTNGGGA
jgi:hypothetical protein